MMENCSSGFVPCAEEDRISNLQEHLIDLIFDWLPVEDAVRTSILSKSWRYRWTTMGALVFDKHFSEKFAKNGAFGRNGLMRIVNQVLFFHTGPIHEFHIQIPNMVLDSFQEVDQWMLFLSRNGVTELSFLNSNRVYELPSYVFSCLNLTKLELEKCFFKPPPEFEGFLKLEELHLYNIDFGASLCESKINLPQLKMLYLLDCTNVYNFNIKATQLQKLIVCECPDAMLLQLFDNPSLLVAGIAFKNSIDDSIRINLMNLVTVLSNLPELQELIIDSHFLKILIAEKTPKLLPRAISSLKLLWLECSEHGDLVQLLGALCLLQNLPNLEHLYTFHVHVDPRVDVEPASDHQESANCLEYMSNRLQTVEMSFVEGSRPELLFIKLLLAHSPSLERFTITPSGDSDVKRILDIAKDVMEFPRASTKAKMVFLDPEPLPFKNV